MAPSQPANLLRPSYRCPRVLGSASSRRTWRTDLFSHNYKTVFRVTLGFIFMCESFAPFLVEFTRLGLVSQDQETEKPILCPMGSSSKHPSGPTKNRVVIRDLRVLDQNNSFLFFTLINIFGRTKFGALG